MKLFLPILLLALISFFIPTSCKQLSTKKNKAIALLPISNNEIIENEEKDEYDGADKVAEFEFMRTKNPVTGDIQNGLLELAIEKTNISKQNALNSPLSTTALSWIERGPNADVVGPSNGNTRANSGITAGRIRAVWVDLSDATGKTVWVGGVNGGIWKTTDITVASPNWTVSNDFLSNLAVTGICQDPTNTNIMYFCTGEGYFNFDAVRGVGVFKSTDAGVTWTPLASTSTYTSCTKILCDASGNIYLGTTGFGFLRSTSLSGGGVWTNISPAGFSSRTADFEISSTGRLHISVGLGNSALGAYRYTDNPSTVTTGTWTTPTTPFTFPSGANCRCELACFGNTLYAAPSNNTGFITQIHKSTDGGATWVSNALTATNINDLNGTNATAQAWYSIGIDIDPSNANNVIVGNLNLLKSVDGGTTWAKLSEWVGTTGQYVHADVHAVKWYDAGNKLLIACDGGTHYSADKGVTIRDRNTNLRIKQFFSCAIHPNSAASPNYFLAGAQDNGVHQLNGAGITSSVEVTGGDGAYVAIDQNEPQYQFGSYVYSVYRRSTNSGANWSTVSWSTANGQFINPWDFDNVNNKIYGSWSAGNYFRWDDAQTGSASAVAQPITAFNSVKVSAVTVSPYTSHQVYFGTEAGRIVKVTNANATPTEANITDAAMPAGAYLNCINTGTDDNNLIACFSNYGVSNIWITTNGGTNWTTIDGNLPDMPIRWVMFFPGNNTAAYAATETGVWETTLINGASTVWTANSSFPTVRTDMLKFRSSDRTILAATHGRGLWSAIVPSSPLPITFAHFNVSEKDNHAILDWKTENEINNKGFEIEKSFDGINFTKIGFLDGAGTSSLSHDYRFADKTILTNIQYYRLKQIDFDARSKYSATVLLKSTNNNPVDLISVTNPFSSSINILFTKPLKQQSKIELFDFNGKKVFSVIKAAVNSNSIQLPVFDNLNKGNYVLKVTTGDQQFIKKLVRL